MSRYVAAAIGVAAAGALLIGGLWAPIEVRHSAPFGFRLTLDAKRATAVRGGFVTANYPDFHRVDLDLRAYDVDADYDLTVHVRPAALGAADVRTVSLSLDGERIRHDKPPFADPFVTVRFPPIADSTGRRYYVWVETGPRNRDDVLALWSIKSYSRVPGREVLAAFLADPPGDVAPTLVLVVLVWLLLALVGSFGWLIAALTSLALAARSSAAMPSAATPSPVPVPAPLRGRSPVATKMRSLARSAGEPARDQAAPNQARTRRRLGGPGRWRPPDALDIHLRSLRAAPAAAFARWRSLISGRG